MDFGLDQLQTWLQLDKLPELTVLLIGVVVGLIGKNLYALVKTILGVAGSFVGRMAFGLWMDLRRETPNVLDCGLAVVTLVEGRPVLLMELNERALHAQGQSAETLLSVLRQELNYEILTFSQTGGWPECAVEGAPLSPNIVAVPKESAEALLKA